MKPFIFLLLVGSCGGAFAQRNAGIPTSTAASFRTTSLDGGNDPFTYGKGIDLNSAKYSDVNGSPFLKPVFTNAFVVFKDGKAYMNVPLKFDMLHNEMDIEVNEKLVSLQGLDSISYPDSIYQTIVFKTGYPAVGDHDTSTIYQLVAQNNKIQLLKYYQCHISTIKSLGLPDKASFDETDRYFLYNKAKKEIEAVKLNKKSFSSAMADMGFSKAVMDKNIDFKNEKEVAGLISSVSL